MNEENPMKYALSFLLGAAMGAAVALLFAPSSGDELRTNIKTQADTQYARLQDEYQKGMQEMHAKMDKMSSELQSMSSRAR
jgi:gas vesicle protein